MRLTIVMNLRIALAKGAKVAIIWFSQATANKMIQSVQLMRIRSVVNVLVGMS